jgi:hypothetical protein
MRYVKLRIHYSLEISCRDSDGIGCDKERVCGVCEGEGEGEGEGEEGEGEGIIGIGIYMAMKKSRKDRQRELMNINSETTPLYR